MPQGVSASDVISTVIKLESPYQQFLAPNAAINDDKVYLLENDVGAWGQSVYSVREVSVIQETPTYSAPRSSKESAGMTGS